MRCTSAKFFAIIFSIMMVASVAVVPTFIHAADETAIEQEALNKISSLKLIDCNSSIIWSGMDCLIPQLTYFFLYIPAMGLLALSGYIFDFVLALSIDKFFIEQPFVDELWGVIRDFTNMLFIFILLYTGVQTMFGFGKWQSTIIKVVIIALLVNFSMFFTKVVIDAGNILAVGVYQGMGATKVAGIDRPHKTEAMTKGEKSVPERTVSATLVNALKPQQFSKLSADNKSGAATIFVIAAIVCAYTAFIFAKASFLFIGRIIAFWFLMAVSPFALISMTLPKGNIWSWWTDTLIKQSFVAPVFLIFIYFIMKAIKSLDGVLQNGTDISESFFDKIVISVVVTAMIMFALKKALGIAEDMSGKFGKIGADALGKAMSSFPMGMALGGSAMLLRRTVGSTASKVLQSGALQKMSSNPNSGLARFTGRTLHGVADKAHNSSFDARNSDTVKWVAKNAKSAFDVKMDLGKGGGKGGYKAIVEQAEKDAKAQAEKMKVTSAEKEKFGPGYSVAKENEEEHKATLAEATNAHKNAEKKAKETKEWKEVEKLEEDIKTATSSFKSTEEGLVKQIEDLKKKQKDAQYQEEADSLQEKINKSEEDLKRAKDDLESKKNKLRDAEIAYNATSEVMFVKEAEIAKKMAEDTHERGQKIIRDTEKWENEQNEERRKYSAENSMNSYFSPNKYFVSKADRASVVKKIRKGDSKDKKKQEEFNKRMKKLYEESQKAAEEKPEVKEVKEEESKS